MTSDRHDKNAPATEARSTRRRTLPVPGRESEARRSQTELHLCPFLATGSGTWRASFPVREHECAAVEPPVPLAMEKQRRLCLTDAHHTCATYLAGLELRRQMNGFATEPRSGRPVPSTTPVLLERARSAVPVSLPLPAASRTSGQVLLVALLVVAFVAIAIARFGVQGGTGQASPTASPSSALASTGGVIATPSPSVEPTPVPSPSPSVQPTPAPTPSPSVARTPSPTPSPPPTVKPSKPPATPTPTPPHGTRTYTVKFGDTLSSIAAHFGVTVASIQKLNGITDPSLIHPGDVLQIP